MTVQAMRCYSMVLAEEIGEKPAQLIHQIDFWLSKPQMGYVKGDKRYIKNRLCDWLRQENFPHWSLSTLRRAFKKLEDLGILLKEKIGHKWDQTLAYTLDYSHALLVKAGYGQSEQMELSEENRSSCSKRTNGVVQNEQKNNYIQYPKNTSKENLQKAPVSLPSSNTLTASQRTRTYREEYPLADSWLKSTSKNFQKAVESYADLHCNRKEVKYPRAVKMRIIVEVWKKYQGLPSTTDFEYIDHSEIRGHDCSVPTERRETAEELFDKEMERLYETSQICSIA